MLDFSKNFHKYLFSLYSIFIVLNREVESTNDPSLCKYGDGNCITNRINELLQKNEENAFFHFTKADPFLVKKMHLERGTDSTVNVDLAFVNNLITGLNRTKILKVTGFGSDLTQKHSLTWHNDVLSLTGDYKVDGKILVLPIVGEGTSNVTVVGANFTMKFRGAEYDKDGKSYMKTDKLHLDVEVEKVIFQINNLFNGDQVLGDSMNKFLNENWLDIYKEIKRPFLKELADLLGPLIDRVFSSHPYKELFLN